MFRAGISMTVADDLTRCSLNARECDEPSKKSVSFRLPVDARLAGRRHRRGLAPSSPVC